MTHENENQKEKKTLTSGRITQLKAQIKNPLRVSVFIEGNFAFGIYQDTLVAFGLYKEKQLSVAEQQEIIAFDQLHVAKQVALNFIAYRPRTCHEVKQKLQTKFFAPEVIEQVIEKLQQLGFLEDRKFAVQFVEARFNHKGYGPLRLKQDLYQRGVPREIIEQVVSQKFESEEDVLLAAALQHAEKKWNLLSSETDKHKKKKKLFDYLARRGFQTDTIFKVFEIIT